MADVYVAWKEPATGRVLLSRRTATGYALPQLAANQSSAVVIPLKHPAPAWANLAYSFSRPLDTVPVIGAASSYIYALSDKLPKNPADASSTFRQHSQMGTIASVDILEDLPPGQQGPPTSTAHQGLPSPTSHQGPPTPTGQQEPPKTPVGKGAQNVTASCIDGSTFCLYGTPDGKNNVLFTVHAAGNGLVYSNSLSNALDSLLLRCDIQMGWSWAW